MISNKYLIFALAFLVISCDPESCRDCEIFNYPIEDWNSYDESATENLIFTDINNNEFEFFLSNVEYSAPYKECQIASSDESVACNLVKSIIYECEDLDLNIEVNYNQYQDLLNYNEVAITYGFRNANEDLFFQISPIYLPMTEYYKELAFQKIDSLEVGDQKYFDVLKLNIDFMIDPIDNGQIAPKFITALSFKEKTGLVEISTMEHGDLILKE